eukprot:Sspe_Gene.71547::Locus_42456_Transcript_1_2_Confidence_0.667_Length_1233::g.71547::m.71547
MRTPRAEALKDEGNELFKLDNFTGAVSLWRAAVACREKEGELIDVQLASNLAFGYLKLRRLDEAQHWAEEGLLRSKALSTPHRTLQTKLEARLQAIQLERDIEENSAQSMAVSVTRPTTLPKSLRDAILASGGCRWAVTGEYAVLRAGDGPRFIGTAGALTCLVVTAWCHGVGFVAHIPIGALLHGCIRSFRNPGEPRHPLQELIDGLCHAFAGEEPVVVRLFGGHRQSDRDRALQIRYPKTPEKHFFSFHVKEAVERALGKRGVVCCGAMNAFEGVDMIASCETEFRLREEGQRLVLLALDIETGAVVTQSKDEEGIIPPEAARDLHLPVEGTPLVPLQ